jgi:hypothetical protein
VTRNQHQKKFEHLKPCALCLTRVGFGKKTVAKTLRCDRKAVIRWRTEAGIVGKVNRKPGAGSWKSIDWDEKARRAQLGAWKTEWLFKDADDCKHWLKHPIARMALARAYYKKNSTRIYLRVKNNPEQKIRKTLRTRMYCVLKGKKKSARTLELLGCSLPQARAWIEGQFKRGMTWSNHGTHWHIDHKIPCASFQLSDPAQQRICFHYTNLQPLEAKANIRKRDRFLATQIEMRIGCAIKSKTISFGFKFPTGSAELGTVPLDELFHKSPTE